MKEARLEDPGTGLAPTEDGWFVVNVRDATWLNSDDFGSGCIFDSHDAWFKQVGINISVLLPGEPNCLYHSESQQESFLVLSGRVQAARRGRGAAASTMGLRPLPRRHGARLRRGRRRPVRGLDGRGADRRRAAALPRLGARSPVRRERGGDDAGREPGVCEVRAAPEREAAVLGPASLGVSRAGYASPAGL